jgi:hypothetical protein
VVIFRLHIGVVFSIKTLNMMKKKINLPVATSALLTFRWRKRKVVICGLYFTMFAGSARKQNQVCVMKRIIITAYAKKNTAH